MRCNCSFSLIVGHVNKQMNKQSSLIHDGIIIIITVHHYTIDATELYTVTVHLLYRQDTLGYMWCFLCHSDICTLSFPFLSLPFPSFPFSIYVKVSLYGVLSSITLTAPIVQVCGGASPSFFFIIHHGVVYINPWHRQEACPVSYPIILSTVSN